MEYCCIAVRELPCHRTRRGFTLIEILVVIGIIALLAALIFPVFAAVREKGRRTACASNMRQLGMALMQYTQDNNEQEPDGMFYNRFALNMGWAGRIYPYIKNAAVFDCSDDPTRQQIGAGDLQAYPVSYALNTNLAKYPHLASQTAPANTVLLIEVTGDSTPLQERQEWGPYPNTAQFVSPAADGLDCDIFATNNYASTSAGPVRYATGRIDNFQGYLGSDFYAGQIPRHQGGANYLAADGHVKFLMPKAVSAGFSANTPSGIQAHTGCANSAGCHHCAPCAEGTALGAHTLTFSVN